MNEFSLYIHSLTLSYASPIIIEGNACIPQGSITYILGASGSGKSTLMQSLIGLLPPHSGSIYLGNNNIYTLPPEVLYQHIGVVFQSPALFEHETLFRNIEIVLEQNTTYSPYKRKEKIKDILTRVGLAHHIYSYPSELSGGMKKRASLARTLAVRKNILFCDEPTSGLDPVTSQEIDKLLFDLHSESPDMTLCIVSHDIQSALTYGNNIIFIHNHSLLHFPDIGSFIHTNHDYIQGFLRTIQNKDKII